MAFNLWTANGNDKEYAQLTSTAYHTTIRSIPVERNKDYVIKFKAYSLSGTSQIRTSLFATTIKYVTATKDLTEFIVEFNSGASIDAVFIYGYNNANDIYIRDIEIVEKSLGKATINGIDGFRSGKWALHANAKSIDDETLELNATASNSHSTLDAKAEGNTRYTVNYEQTGAAYSIYEVNASGTVTVTHAGKSSVYSFTTALDTVTLRLYATNGGLGAGRFIFKRPMLNKGDILQPYEPKRGERMVLPVVGKNLINKDTIQKDMFVTSTTGTVSASGNGNSATDFVPLEPGETYTPTNISSIGVASTSAAFYGKNKEYITFLNYPTADSNILKTFTVPANAYFARFTVKNDAVDIQLEKGAVKTPFENYRVQRSQKSVKIPKKNLFNKETVTKGYALDLANGNIAINAPYSVSDFIEIKPGAAYIKTPTNGYCYYSSSKVFIGPGGSGSSMVAYLNAAYVRITVPTADLDITQLEEGTVQTAYDPYKLQTKRINGVPKKNLVPGEKEKNNTLFNQGTGSGPDNVWENGRLKVTAGSSNHNGKGLAIPVELGKTYTLSCLIDDSGSGTSLGAARILVGSADKTSDYSTMFYPGVTPGGFTFTAISNTVWIRFLINGQTTLPPVYFWNIQLEEGVRTPYEPFRSGLRPARKGLEFNGFTDYMLIPSITADSIEVDCLVDSTQPIAAPFVFDARNDAQVWVSNASPNISNTTQLYVDGAATNRLWTDIPKDRRVKVKAVHPSSFTASVGFFTNISRSSRTKGIIYGIKYYLNGVVVAEYDITNYRSIIGTKVKAKIGPDGTITGSPIQLNKPATR
jgi:hypothetical protein